MSTEEHLYENLMIFVQENGWQAFPELLTDEEAETIRKKVLCAEFIDNKTFIYLMGLARYVVYNGTVNEEVFCNIDKGVKMNEFVEAAKKRAAEKKELRNKMRDEAMKFVDEYKKENGSKSFISLRIRDGYIGKELGGGKLQMERTRPRGTLVAIKGENGQVHVGFTYLSNKDEDIPIVGIAQALKEAILEKEKGISKVIKSRDVELLNFFTIRAKCFFYPELYSYSRGTEKIEYPKYDLIHSNRKKVLDFLGKTES